MIELSRRALVSVVLSGLWGCREQPALPELGTVGTFELKDQDGRRSGSAELTGKVWAAAFMFTRCPTICPRITRRMKELQAEAKKKQVKIELVSFSVDPDYDTPAVLKQYASEHGADLASWRFLTGDLAVVKRTALDGFKMALDGKADPAAKDFGILHGSHLVLVDPKLAVRGYYRTSDDGEMSRLLTDAATLA